MLSTVGFLMILAIVVLLLREKMSPIVVLIAAPVVAALVLGTPVADIGTYVADGIKIVHKNAILFIFSIIFFGVMSDTGVFDLLVNSLVRFSGNNVVAITVTTAVIGIISHLDGSTATTVLITVPSMYPIYQRMKIRKYVLLCLVGAAMGVMNLLPWGGPVARAASVMKIEATDLWMKLIPVQVFGIVAILALAVILGYVEKKRGAGLSSNNNEASGGAVIGADSEAAALRRPKLMWFNLLLTVTVIAVLCFDLVPSYLVFMLGLAVALFVNYPGLKAQNDRIKANASAALIISATVLAAGVMVGIMSGTEMITAMAHSMTAVVPPFLGRFTHLIFGALALPMGLMIGTDAYFFGLMPPILEVGSAFGVAPINTACAMVIGKNVSLLISPLVPATFLALGLVDGDFKKHLSFSFPWLYALSLVMVVASLFLGVIVL